MALTGKSQEWILITWMKPVVAQVIKLYKYVYYWYYFDTLYFYLLNKTSVQMDEMVVSVMMSEYLAV